jgi:hypothetical protein
MKPSYYRRLREKQRKEMIKERNNKISESHAVRKEACKQFGIGDLVQQKYFPKSFGIVISKPSVRRDDKYGLVPEAYISVMWMNHPYFYSNETIKIAIRYLAHKKVVETKK